MLHHLRLELRQPLRVIDDARVRRPHLLLHMMWVERLSRHMLATHLLLHLELLKGLKLLELKKFLVLVERHERICHATRRDLLLLDWWLRLYAHRLVVLPNLILSLAECLRLHFLLLH